MDDMMGSYPGKISVVTPTLNRPEEVNDLLDNLSLQTLSPYELVLVDGAPREIKATEELVTRRRAELPFKCRYIRRGGGTAIQRNIGIDAAVGDFIAFIDDDIRLRQDFLHKIIEQFALDVARRIGGITGYITNQHLDPQSSPRWRWYRRLNLFTTYEPGRYDFETGYPINRYLQAPHETVREVDVMGAGCAVWRREVFDDGVRFHPYFVGFGVLEDAHLALQARQKNWTLLEHGKARCEHLRSERSRENTRLVTFKSTTNPRFVFINIVPQRTIKQEFRFWRVQVVDMFRILAYALRTGTRDSWCAVIGKGEGIIAAARLKPNDE